MTTQAGGMAWIAVADATHGRVWRAHFRQYLLRARELADVWVIGRETACGFVFVSSGHTMTQAALSAREVLA